MAPKLLKIKKIDLKIQPRLSLVDMYVIIHFRCLITSLFKFIQIDALIRLIHPFALSIVTKVITVKSASYLHNPKKYPRCLNFVERRSN